jgi:hypothetical protein
VTTQPHKLTSQVAQWFDELAQRLGNGCVKSASCKEMNQLLAVLDQALLEKSTAENEKPTQLPKGD